jgi:transcriptional regulator with XRE-family HTH domain
MSTDTPTPRPQSARTENRRRPPGTRTFGTALRRLRVAAGLNQQALAAEAGVTQQAVSRLETGCSQPTWETVRRLARALGTDPSAFQGG